VKGEGDRDTGLGEIVINDRVDIRRGAREGRPA
jgi:hypothetical protein